MSTCERPPPTENEFSEPPPLDRPFGSEEHFALTPSPTGL